MNIFTLFKRKVQDVLAKMPFIELPLLGFEKTYGKAQKTNFALQVENYRSWAYACINRNAFSIAKCKLNLYKRMVTKEGAKLEPVTEHPFLDLMRNVNPFHNRFELWMLTDIFLESCGNSYWWLNKDAFGVPRAIWNIPAHWVKVVPSKDEFISGYVVEVPNKRPAVPLEEDEVIHFKFPSPFDLFYGTSPVLGAAFGLDMNTHAKTWLINFFMNNAQPTGALVAEDTLGEKEFKRLKDEWERRHKGSGKAGKIAFLTGGLKYQQIGSDLSKMKLEGITKDVRDEILACFGVPASKLGLVEDVNRANADANDYTYQKDTILPRLLLIEEKLNEKLMPMFDPALVVKFESPVPEDREFRLKEQTEHIKSGYSSIDDEREIDGLEPYNLPETQTPLLPISVMPAGSEPESAGTNPGKAMTKEMAKTARRQRKWEVFVAVIGPQERIFGRVMREYFQLQHSEVMRAFNNYRSQKDTKAPIDETILFNITEQKERLRGTSRPYIREAYISGINLGNQDLGAGVDFDLIEPNIERAISTRINFFSEKVNESTLNLLRTQLTAANQAGESIQQVAKRIDKVFQFSEDFRSKRIARTEIVGGTNQGQLDAYLEAGVEQKEWITARDERVRDSHMIDGQVVDIADSFTTGLGSHLLHPGDRTSGAPAEDIINCRCTVNPIVKK